MAAFSCTISFPIWCSSGREGNDPSRQNLSNIKINGTSNKTWTKVDSTLRQTAGVATTFGSVASVVDNGYIDKQQVRQNIPTKKQFVDLHRQGIITEGGVGYQQTVVIRSYEVGPDKTATIESILNLFQVIAETCFYDFRYKFVWAQKICGKFYKLSMMFDLWNCRKRH